MNPKIIICDCDHKDVEPERAVFDAAHLDFKWLRCSTQDEIIEKCQGAVCFLNQYAKMDEKIFANIPTLKFISRYGVGVDNVNLDDAAKYGVQIGNVPDYGTNEVADHAVSLMLALVRKTYMVANMTRAGLWNYAEIIPVHRLSARTVGIIGAGRIGVAFANRVRAFGCRIIAHDIRHGKEGFSSLDFVEYVKTVDEVLAEADILSLHCSLNEDNQKMMNAESFAKMKDGAFLINVARGGLVDEIALDAALASGRLAGAALDVAAVEPLSKESPLFRHKNLMVTPHMAWYSAESSIELKRKCAEEAVRFVRGEKIHYPVNCL